VPRKSQLKNVKRIVVKVGTSSVTEEGLISPQKIGTLVDDICSLISRGYKVALVSSGAITAGAGVIHKKKNNLSIPEKQAMAAVGQTILMNEYGKRFKKKGIIVGQILLTEDDVKHRRRFLNARNTMNSLLDMGMVPIINENDSVVVKEIKFGDNDTLSAHVTNIIDAQLLILLSDIDGFYMDLNDDSPVEEINKVTPDIYQRAGGSSTSFGTGGMSTKIRAAEMILGFGDKMIIADASIKGVLNKIMDGEKIGTLFSGNESGLSSKRKWLSARQPKGRLVLDQGAAAAVRDKHKSLLATGIKEITGSFDMGDVVALDDEDGNMLAKGIVKYKWSELEIIKGKKTHEMKEILGIKYFEEVVHRDDMYIFSGDHS
jgi:glutamate 5-kinase